MMDWNTAVAEYLGTLTAGTRRQYELSLKAFDLWYELQYHEIPDPALLTKEELRDWQKALLEKKNEDDKEGKKHKASTVNQRIAAIKGLSRHCGRMLEIKGIKRVEKPIEPLNGRELGRLFAVAEGDSWQDARDVALLSLMARAGLRVAEVCALNQEDIRINARSGEVLIRRGKGEKERPVALGLECRKDLTAYLNNRPDWPTDKLFFSKTGKDLATRDVERLVEKLVRLAGIERPITPHTLRHTFATRFLRDGGDLATLQKLMGHENIVTTSRYLHPDADRVQEMVERL